MDVAPYELKGKTACDFCAYRGVCGLDARTKGFHVRRLPVFDDKEIWRRIEEENPDESQSEKVRLCEEATVLLSIENLLSYHWVEEAVQAGTLTLHALYYDMLKGSLNVWNGDSEDFEPIAK